jgi:hypothetical protein
MSIEQLEGEVWPAPEPGDTGLVEACHRLRKKPLSEFTPNDLRLMIGQKIGLLYLMPHAIDVLEGDPLIEAVYFPGDLLESVLMAREFWSVNQDFRGRLTRVAEQALTTLGQEDRRLNRSLSEFLANSRA